MEKNKSEGIIDNIYIITEKKGSGGNANVFLVTEKNKSEQYVAKVSKNDEDKKQEEFYNNEVQYLSMLKESHNPYILKYIAHGMGEIIRYNRNKGQPLIKKYIILEYASKRELSDFILYTKEGLGERKSKLLFYEIIEGMKDIHSKGICHRDIKLENILLAEGYIPKIADFGYAIKNSNDLTDYIGTRQYASPEILANVPYDGCKADIFSLGVTLMFLTFGKPGFEEGSSESKLYLKIMKNKINEFWNKVEPNIILFYEALSKEFKDLYIHMVDYNQDKRFTIDQVMNHDWFKSIREMEEEERKKLQNEIKEEFTNRESKIEDSVKREIDQYNAESEELNNRGSEDEYKHFPPGLKPYEAPNDFDTSFSIKFKGSIDPNKFMNFLYELIDKEYNENVYIKANKEKLKLKASFEDEKGHENENIKGNDVTIKIKFYEYKESFYLKFVKVMGSKKSFYDKFNSISDLIQKYI